MPVVRLESFKAGSFCLFSIYGGVENLFVEINWSQRIWIGSRIEFESTKEVHFLWNSDNQESDCIDFTRRTKDFNLAEFETSSFCEWVIKFGRTTHRVGTFLTMC